MFNGHFIKMLILFSLILAVGVAIIFFAGSKDGVTASASLSSIRNFFK